MSSSEKILQDEKSEGTIRFLTFNVNGIRTFFHYQPFSQMNQSLRSVFDFFQADIITFQELKTEKLSISKWGKVDGFYSFVSIPQARKGYSGVGCWVRIPDKNQPMYHALQVVKAEEGITGYLTIKNGKQAAISYRDDVNQGIGGYDSLDPDLDEKSALELDSEGRCVMVELACGIVIISVYCPANSNSSEEGELFRIRFLKVLLRRVRNLEKIGKKVVLMGDVNVCRDLIDSADALEQFSIPITDPMGGTKLETQYRDKAIQFIINPDTPHRRIFNQILADSLLPDASKRGVLIDTTRLIQTRNRLRMYTVWNILKNLRPSNYGSRIDFILVSSKLEQCIKAGDILPDVLGSDHCPVFSDLDVRDQGIEPSTAQVTIPKFEARYKYNLRNHNVLEMFAKKENNKKSNNQQYRIAKVINKKKCSSIKKKSLDSFFQKKDGIQDATTKKSLEIPQATQKEISMPKFDFKDVFGKPPLCKHGEESMLKTSKTAANPGKKFWICKRSRGDSKNTESSCGFFQWV
ncbi:DNA-(apurinic or apyrimidinic site) lyase APN2 [Saccharomyces paradoxus]|uniref:DNA-(apurinic or apyrimidinic site) endonuclease 2 n=1 Tax=Saccharomyces paradoxus TaxID=27291 RepID=A0A8B8UL99_SACPA|nr:Apn2 [Saccharomyces paradoxus]QHS71548.1 Apn2 [Saccharomyces paradoxus]